MNTIQTYLEHNGKASIKDAVMELYHDIFDDFGANRVPKSEHTQGISYSIYNLSTSLAIDINYISNTKFFKNKLNLNEAIHNANDRLKLLGIMSKITYESSSGYNFRMEIRFFAK